MGEDRQDSDNGFLVMPKRLPLKWVVGIVAFLVTLAGHAAQMEYRLVALEAEQAIETKSIRRIELTLCQLCTALLDKDSCSICEGD